MDCPVEAAEPALQQKAEALPEQEQMVEQAVPAVQMEPEAERRMVEAHPEPGLQTAWEPAPER